MTRYTLLLTIVLAQNVAAEEIHIVLWNGEKLFSVDDVEGRADDLGAFATEFPDADIIVLDEVTSIDVVKAVRDRMGYTGFHTACSDFSQNDNLGVNSLEVGIISRFPLTNVVEFDPSTDNTGQPGEPGEEPLVDIGVPGISNLQTSRGFLTADVADLGITLVCTHLKSSQRSSGQSDHDNAKKRELVAASIARFVAGRLSGNGAATVLVAGDMNVGETDRTKNGFRLTEDNFTALAGDLYDDTHAIFSNGLVDGLHMASLTKGLGTETFDDPQFAGSGPIDCIYVIGRQAGDFTLATKSEHTFGSDHFAVSTRFLFSGTVPAPEPGDPTPQPGMSSSVRIVALLPNPEGPDPGNEWIKLKNDTASEVDLNGWTLRDEANHTVALSGTIAAGEERQIDLADGELPLNNSGDEVELIDVAGDSVDFATYTGGQASSGNVVVVSR